MAAYREFPWTRGTQVSLAALNTALRAGDATAAVVGIAGGVATLKKNTPWLPAEIAYAQNVLDVTPEWTPQRNAQAVIDTWPIELRAAFVIVMEEINKLRALQVPVLPAYTTAQFIAAIRAKAAIL